MMFATRQAAVDAQKNLHEKKTLPGVSFVQRGRGIGWMGREEGLVGESRKARVVGRERGEEESWWVL